SNKDEVGQLARTIGKMQVNLRETVATNRRSDWLKTGLVRLNDALRGEQDRARLATLAITEICSYLDALVGVLFVMQEEGSDAGALTLLGSFAHTERTSVATRFLPGEGLVGQAALERRQILISQPPADYIRVVSGLGETPPGRICVTPFLFEDRVRGVVEIGSLGELDALGLDYLRQAAQVLGISFETAQGRLRLARELERTKSMTSELQVQQEELRVSNEELQEKNELLTRQKREVDGARKAIAEKVEELTRSGKYKSEFLANMSHELRTPLNSLLLLAGGLADNRENNLSPDQLESARIIQASGNDLLSLINEILDLAKIESGQMKLELSKISLKTFVDAIDESFGQMAREQGLALNLEIGSDLPADFETDPRRLLQVLKNLISNALKFTEAGSVTLRMHRPEPGTDLAWSGLDPGSAIAISVLDTGIGIAPENQTLVFEAFQQVDGGSARKYLGTGLGLSISRELVQLLGGEIQLASELGRGSVFTLYLPLKAPRAGEPPTREPSERQEGKLSDDRGAIGRAKRLLVVGDDEGTRRHLVELLKGKEVLVDEAGSSEEAKTAIARERYDCVILDLDLWDMDGADFLGSLAREQGGELPALIIHTARELTREEESRLREYTESIVLRNVRSDERLLDEVSLFLHRAERDMPAPQQRIIAELKGSNSGLKGKRILLADDDMRSAFALSKLLTGRGLEVIKAENGEKALMVLAEDPSIDLVLMDVMMPVMDGYEAIRRIRAEERFARLPLIALTAKAMAGDRDACLAAGASDYQTKPIDPDRLISMIRVWLAT
ncbi:MAG: response regulator, partial [Spirochaetota bacterium]